MKTPRNAEEMLTAASEFLQDEDVPVAERKKVWDVFSGLRGPDNNDKAAKEAITAPIRYAFLKLGGSGRVTKSFARPTVVSARDTDENRQKRDRNLFQRSQPKHFRRHAAKAFKALGLKWKTAPAAASPSYRSPYSRY